LAGATGLAGYRWDVDPNEPRDFIQVKGSDVVVNMMLGLIGFKETRFPL
jgi:hypothetical protein